jgi:hypothetical protein
MATKGSPIPSDRRARLPGVPLRAMLRGCDGSVAGPDRALVCRPQTSGSWPAVGIAAPPQTLSQVARLGFIRYERCPVQAVYRRSSF